MKFLQLNILIHLWKNYLYYKKINIKENIPNLLFLLIYLSSWYKIKNQQSEYLDWEAEPYVFILKEGRRNEPYINFGLGLVWDVKYCEGKSKLDIFLFIIMLLSLSVYFNLKVSLFYVYIIFIFI